MESCLAWNNSKSKYTLLYKNGVGSHDQIGAGPSVNLLKCFPTLFLEAHQYYTLSNAS